MKALVLDEERRLELRDVPEPEPPRHGQTLVDVRAAGVNYADVLIREGRYPQPPPLPYVPGSEIAGTTADGRRVVGFVRVEGGGYAEKVAVEDDWLFDLPATASFEQGAAFVLAYLTAWIPLTRQVVLRPGARVLVTAAAGGVGSAGVQLAASLGAHVVGAVGSPEKRDHVLGLGAAEAVLYDEVGGLEPFDVILDQVGGEVFAGGARAAAAARDDRRSRVRGRCLADDRPRAARRPEQLGRGLLPRAADAVPARARPRRGRPAARAVGGRLDHALRRSGLPARRGVEALRMVAERRSTGKVVLLP